MRSTPHPRSRWRQRERTPLGVRCNDSWAATGCAGERRGQFDGEEFLRRFGAVLLPELMLHVGMLAQQFHAPWGCAFLRLKAFGRIRFDDRGIAHWVPEQPNGRANLTAEARKEQ